MAVAVKSNRETNTPNVLDRLPVGIVAGMLYVLGSIGIVFPLLDAIWWRWLGLERTVHGQPNVLAWSLLLVVGFLVALGLSVLGLRLLGPRPTPGLRAGITFGLVWILIAALLTDWFGMWLANSILAGQWFWPNGRSVGIGLTAGVGVILLVLGFRFLFSAGTERRLIALEEQGWFTTAAYKRSQGVRVRRGTILGILILAAFGVWSLHNTLSREGGDWIVSFPFTGNVLVELNTAGDNPMLKAKLKEMQTQLDLETAGKDLELLQNAVHDHPDLPRHEELADNLEKAGKELAALKEETEGKGETLEDNARLRTRFDEVRKQLTATRQALDAQKVVVAAAPKTPLAVQPIDRFALVDLNRGFESTFVKVKTPGQDPNLGSYEGPDAKAALKHWDKTTIEVFKPGEIVSKVEFDQVSDALRQDRKKVEEKGGDANLIRLPVPEDAGGKAQVTPAGGDIQYTQMTLLPGTQFTIPLIVGALLLWLAWRLVNVPAFADFLIATEAEMNKVSWATRRQLAQDTVVVLVTVILLTFFLFCADIIWSQGLKAIGVLQSGQQTTQQTNQEVPW